MFGDFSRLSVIEIQPRNGNPASGGGGLFLDGAHVPGGIDFYDAVTLRIRYGHAEYHGSRLQGCRPLELGRKFSSVKKIVAQNESRVFSADEVFTDDERLRQSLGFWLYGVFEMDAEGGAVAQQGFEAADVVRGGDEQNFAYARLHERRDGIMNHRLIINGQHLFAEKAGEGVETRAVSAGEDDSFHGRRRERWARYQRTVCSMPVSKGSVGFQPSSV